MFGLRSRTNNYVESHNSRLRSVVASTANFYKFSKDLASEEMRKSQQMLLLLEGHSTAKKPVDKFLQRSALIERAQKKMVAGNTTVAEFLNEISFQFNTGVIDENALNHPCDDDSEEESDEEEDVGANKCRLCKVREQMVVMLPCRHNTICMDCFSSARPTACMHPKCGAAVNDTLVLRF